MGLTDAPSSAPTESKAAGRERGLGLAGVIDVSNFRDTTTCSYCTVSTFDMSGVKCCANIGFELWDLFGTKLYAENSEDSK